MTRRFFALCVLGTMALSGAPRPKLVLAIAIDQFRYDYLTRFRPQYTAGLDRLLENGAVFTNAFYRHFPTVTAIGHSIFLTGATPSLSGIVGNEWYDRESGRQVTSVSDDAVKLLGGQNKPGCSPHRLLVSTLGDEMKMAGGRPRVIGVSLKDRSAVLPAGHMADGAYWFDLDTGNFVSSTFYFRELPAWVKRINDTRPGARYLGAEWKSLDGTRVLRKLAGTADTAFYRSLEATPFGNEIVEEFAERAIEAEQLGQDDDTDLLAVSFSANDYLGHDVGPDAPEVREMSIQTDRLLGKFLQFVDARIGLGDVLVAFTSDHGVAPLPEVMQERRMPGGRLAQQSLHQAIEAALSRKYGEGKWIAGLSGPTSYLNRDLIRQKGLDEAAVQETAAAALAATPHIARVYTRAQLLKGEAAGDPLGRRVLNGFHPQRAGDLFILTEPYWFFSARGASHGSPYGYDSHVPVIFMGPGVRPGRYHRAASPNDIAPTLATLLAVETPSGSVGRVLEEILALDGAPSIKIEKKARSSR